MYTRLSAFYLFYFLAAGVYFPFVSLFYKDLGFSGEQIGLLGALAPLAGIALGPVWGYLADQRGWRLPLLRWSLLLAALGAPLLLLPRSFGPVALVVGLVALCLSPAIPLADATTLEWVKRTGWPATYGKVRLWGAMGFILGGLAGGRLFTLASVHLLFGVYGVLLLGPFAAALAIPARRGIGRARPRGQGHALSLLRHPVLGPFYLCSFLAYVTTASYNGFFSLYMRSLGAGSQQIGLAIAVGSVSELPVMWYSGRLIARFGARSVVLAALCLYTLRWGLLALIHDPLLATASQCLNGPTFGAFYVAGVTFVDSHVPADLRATGQSLYNAATFGLAAITGSLIFGYLLDHGGVFRMYGIASAVCAAATALLALLVRDRAATAAPGG